MENKNYELSLRMNSELLISYDSLFDDIALFLAINKILPYEDMDNEEAMDDLLEKSYSLKSMLVPLLDYRRNESGVMDALLDSEVISMSMMDSIREIITYAKSQVSISEDVFSPYDLEDDDDMSYKVKEFMTRLLSVYRVKSCIKDIMDGMVEYGRDAYVVTDIDNEEGYDVLETLSEMSTEDLFREWPCYLGSDDDTDEEQIHKAKLCDLIKELLKYADKEN